MPPITLLSDFGHGDSYVAEMKAVMLRIAGETQALIDISHELPAFDIRRAAFLLADCIPVFPPETIHLAVVDPGVGSSRKRLVLRFKLGETGTRQWFVGPDNGLCSFLLGSPWQAWEITEIPPQFRFATSSTFDGRDFFAATAALIARGLDPASFCAPLAMPVQLTAPRLDFDDHSVEGELVYIDRYGNAATSIKRADVQYDGEEEQLLLEIPQASRSLSLCTHFAELEKGVPGALWNSHGRLEIVAREQSAVDLLQLVVGQSVRLRSRTTIPVRRASAQPA